MNAKSCPNCQQLVTAEAVFCGRCGQQFAQTPPPEASPPPPLPPDAPLTPPPAVPPPPDTLAPLPADPSPSTGPASAPPQTPPPPVPGLSVPPPAQQAGPPPAMPPGNPGPLPPFQTDYSYAAKSPGGASKTIVILVSFVVLIALAGAAVVFLLSGSSNYAKAGIDCKSYRVDDSTRVGGIALSDEALGEIRSFVKSIKVCTLEDEEGSWELFRASDFSRAMQIIIDDKSYLDESSFCDDSPLGEDVIAVGSDVFSGADAASLSKPLEENGFEVQDYKPSFCD